MLINWGGGGGGGGMGRNWTENQGLFPRQEPPRDFFLRLKKKNGAATQGTIFGDMSERLMKR